MDKVLKALVNTLSLIYSPHLLPHLLQRLEGHRQLPGLLVDRTGMPPGIQSLALEDALGDHPRRDWKQKLILTTSKTVRP